MDIRERYIWIKAGLDDLEYLLFSAPSVPKPSAMSSFLYGNPVKEIDDIVNIVTYS